MLNIALTADLCASQLVLHHADLFFAEFAQVIGSPGYTAVIASWTTTTPSSPSPSIPVEHLGNDLDRWSVREKG